ncbi:methylated-DNA--[protein]-cysteine S-methyltransferase [Lysobacter alkalisoli]|uniref:Methylated-DNA--protein-cysteine methyltransferase n=2 Tax=Marilutibacter alkalisoli TaxID=2591633 RepID=A0A514BWG0_9GAMM|nr:methylated-DNA--[protein]-cysteine S-methyltransferase [Lysobacter alkalisoli]
MSTPSRGTRSTSTQHLIFHRILPSPVGPLRLAASDAGVHAIEFHAQRHPVPRDARWQEGDHPLLEQVATQLDEYFSNQRTVFDLPLAPQGTEFQRAVWFALAAIPFGETVSYAQLAARIGKPAAVRAVGAANGRNPIPIVLPCHRVIGADGSLTGFGGGLPTKQFLLELEGALAKDEAAGDLFAA